MLSKVRPNKSVVMIPSDTFGVDQFNFGTTEPLSNAISRVSRAVKSASGSSC